MFKKDFSTAALTNIGMYLLDKFVETFSKFLPSRYEKVSDFLFAVGIFGILGGIGVHTVKRGFMQLVRPRKWWPRAMVPQRQVMYNFGFPKDPTPNFPTSVNDELCLEAFCYTVVVCLHHLLCASCMLPLICSGWENASTAKRNLFISGVMMNTGFDAFDFILVSVRTFFPRLGLGAFPFAAWLVLPVCHHTLSMALAIPMSMKYPHLPEYHRVAFTMLLAPGLSFLLGNYKFTLDVREFWGFFQFKSILAFQLLSTLYFRLVVFFPAFMKTLKLFKSKEDWPFFTGTAFFGGLISFFNVALSLEVIVQAVRWLPEARPSTKEQEFEVEVAMAEQDPSTDFVLSPNARKRLHLVRDFKAKSN